MDTMKSTDETKNGTYKFQHDTLLSWITQKWDGQEPFGKFLASVLSDYDTGNLTRLTTDEVETALANYKEGVTAGV